MKIVVKSGGTSGWTDNYSVSDLCTVAAIESLKKRCHDKSFSIPPVITCSVNRKRYFFNTYHLFVQGGMEAQAEILRIKIKQRLGIDLKDEPINDIKL
jgi:hypothetical protein